MFLFIIYSILNKHVVPESEMFMGVHMKNLQEDRVFNLLLKHKFIAKASLEFVKSFLETYTGNKNQCIVDKGGKTFQLM